VEIDCSGPDITVSPLKEKVQAICVNLPAVLRIRIHRIHVFLGLLDPDPDRLVRGMNPDPAPDPDPSIIKQIYQEIP
jgi:hypothetical protein